ncbi:hypothetical protein [Streptomyces chartreusis]|uniref:Lipoprotein n=1 Tax=Streptomyces chartreusis TaxID=1969 RepID=A0A7H8T0Z2_STRCX|nr:hypothetical protein [Streptomyces chartreusis]QKZ17155.1 hypothetical protein HUT05_07115 [Streptomyces chartreusis]
MKINKTFRGVFSLVAAASIVGAVGACADAASDPSSAAVPAAAARPAPSFPKQDPTQCTAFRKSADARKAAEGGQSVIGLWTGIFEIPAAQKLYDAYLTPGPVTHTRTVLGGKQVLTEFRTAPETKKAVTGVVNSLKSKIATTFPVLGTEYDLHQAGLGENIPIAWNNLETTPGFAAGGLSGVVLADGTSLKDDRTIAGKYSLSKQTVNGKTKVTLNVRGLTLTVRDSVDFCPGNLSSGSIRTVSLGLSRLERTPYLDKKKCDDKAKCYYARPALFKVTVPLNDVRVDVTGRFPAPATTTR